MVVTSSIELFCATSQSCVDHGVEVLTNELTSCYLSFLSFLFFLFLYMYMNK